MEALERLGLVVQALGLRWVALIFPIIDGLLQGGNALLDSGDRFFARPCNHSQSLRLGPFG